MKWTNLNFSKNRVVQHCQMKHQHQKSHAETVFTEMTISLTLDYFMQNNVQAGIKLCHCTDCQSCKNPT